MAESRRPPRTSVILPKRTQGFRELVEAGDLALATRRGDEAAGAYVSAMGCCDKANPHLLVRLAQANVVRSRLEEAEVCFSEALELEPHNTAALRGLVAVHHARKEDGAAFWAEEQLLLAVAERTQVLELVESGDRWWAAGHAGRAKIRYATALRMDPNHRRARQRMRDVVNAQLGSVSMTATLVGGITAAQAG